MAEKELKLEAETYIDDHGFLCRKKSKTKVDSHYVEQFVEIPPLAVDDETGEILNKTLVPIIKQVDDYDLYQEIQSYKGDCDIYSILAKFAQTGDTNLLNQGQKTFVDYYNVPDNINDFNKLVKKCKDEIGKYSEEQKEAILNGSNDEVNKLIGDLVKQQLIKQGVIKEQVKEEVK